MLLDLSKLFSRSKNSKDLAKERLKLVLIHDRANVSPQFLEMVKGEIIKVISNYMDVDED
ncbi:MAG: cell division topological specificity factor MinE, partial [Clostridiaceae bacterium]|nr:cell division topological specificity factor MinE [Clostridiaceae bacterium]